MISIIIPFRNDWDTIGDTIATLIENADADDYEIIVVNDGSNDDSGRFKPLAINHPKVRVINNVRNFGVGYAFDRGAEQAKGDMLILMGSDIHTTKGWYEKVRIEINRNPNTLGCAVSVGLAKGSNDFSGRPHRYGADLLFTVEENDLPLTSKLRGHKNGYTSLFSAKWLTAQESKEPYPIPCILGALYFTSKDYFNFLGGWDTEYGNRYRGFRGWGHLEPYISLKSWLCGGGCVLYPNIISGHNFGRVNKENRWTKGARSAEWMWWNALFMLETMILDGDMRRKLYDFINPELNFNIARKMIKDNYDTVLKIRNQNAQKFKYDYKIFVDKFQYCFDI